MNDWAGRFHYWRELRRHAIFIILEKNPFSKLLVKERNHWRHNWQVERSMDKSKDTVTVDRLGRTIQNLARAPLLLDAINVNINSIFAVVMRVRVDVTVATCCSSWSPKHFSIRVPQTSCNYDLNRNERQFVEIQDRYNQSSSDCHAPWLPSVYCSPVILKDNPILGVAVKLNSHLYPEQQRSLA